ncbi:FAD-dependent oxidoreductase [Paenibacillus thalictri]|uniref:FAD-dependent oxidoreductase n=1 Tax=Paenibacillus thalictri TaxID=2527873 RepID=A0A4Q9DN12_9BACL|nr:FAD-dependent oxidoreductase [Paenibacillus thalictri]TBL75244.1 FAD-dependent oxidoreductase [Paenibacillus thalictri]
MREETVAADITIVGGGLSGVCAAIAAARLGRSVALVQNRPVLGGNSSSEVRVWVSGASATGVNRYARESGIMGELYLENQYRNPDGNPYIWDLVVLEAVRAEPNIRLFLNTDVYTVVAEDEGDRRVRQSLHSTDVYTVVAEEEGERRLIRSVEGWMTGSERKLRFASPLYMDCTGDGLVGVLAGAEYRIGREARCEFNESAAPEQADRVTLGSTMFFYTKDAGRPVPFIAPAFAVRIEDTSIPLKRIIQSGDSGCHYWWIEWGGELDTIHDNERIRDELWAVIYGIWDYIKNSGRFDADRLTLEWVGSVPGKRESRRFIGDYVLNQNDIIAQNEFHDRVAYGGWSIDLHPPQGVYSEQGGSKHVHPDGIYHIPFRSLYSRNIGNLLFAGRNISATHVAFGTTRVMATCAIMGEAAGTAAALCASKGIFPRQLYEAHLQELQATLLRQDAALIGLAGRDTADLTACARVTASSCLKQLGAEDAQRVFPLVEDAGLLLPVDPQLDGVELLVTADEDTVLQVEVWNTGRPENYIPVHLQARTEVKVHRGERQWVRAEVVWAPEHPQNAFLIVKANPAVSLFLSGHPVTGVLGFVRKAGSDVSKRLEDRENQPVIEWSMKPVLRTPYCFRLLPETNAYTPDKITDGYHRPYGLPHLWLSDRMGSGGEHVRLEWDAPVTIREVHMTFNDDPNEYLNNLHFLRTPFTVMPELVKDYSVLLDDGTGWYEAVSVTANRKRKRVHVLPQPVTARTLQLAIHATNGSPYAEVVEIRVYGDH